MKLTKTRAKFVESAQKELPGKTELTRQEVLAVTKKANMKVPYWFMRPAYRTDRGTYKLPELTVETAAAVSTTPKSTKSNKTAKTQTKTATKTTKAVKSTARDTNKAQPIEVDDTDLTEC